ncbi:MAG: NAD(P)-dependent oxidoreductase [Candidatus Omnitrophica bacterium]|nr:NAD(P)-dependent oxidoreductase [Candidatus Omnitrophota bacterium]
MNILITGGLGYIGGRLAAYIKETTKNKVVLSTRNKEKKLPAWAADFRVLRMDVLDRNSIEQCLNESQPDVVIHLGASNINECNENSQMAIDVNVKGTYRLLEAAHQVGVKRFVYLSTFHVYGDLKGRITEKTIPKPASMYAVTKRCGEDFVSCFRLRHHMQTLILRLSNVYGCPMDKDVNVWPLAFNSFCRQCVENGKILIKSNQYRDFIAMSDVVRAVCYLLFDVPDQWQEGVFNLGGDQSMSVLKAARQVASIYGEYSGKRLVPVERPLEDPGQMMMNPFRYSIDKLKHAGFQVEGKMKEEVIKTIMMCEALKKERPV